MEKSRRRYFKGQSTLEYLMTYGFAFFVIVFVLAVLFAIVLPALRPPESCQFTQTFSCSQKQHAIFAEGDTNTIKVAFQLDNQGKGVNILKIVCADEPAGNIDRTFVDDYGSAPSGTEKDELGPGASSEYLRTCVDGNGDELSMSPNSNFQGSIAVLYEFENDLATAPDRLAVATLSGIVQEG